MGFKLRTLQSWASGLTILPPCFLSWFLLPFNIFLILHFWPLKLCCSVFYENSASLIFAIRVYSLIATISMHAKTGTRMSCLSFISGKVSFSIFLLVIIKREFIIILFLQHVGKLNFTYLGSLQGWNRQGFLRLLWLPLIPPIIYSFQVDWTFLLVLFGFFTSAPYSYRQPE